MALMISGFSIIRFSTNSMFFNNVVFKGQEISEGNYGVLNSPKKPVKNFPNFCPKGGFYSESAIRFLDLQISKKKISTNYPELEI